MNTVTIKRMNNGYHLSDGKIISSDIVEESVLQTQEKFKLIGGLAVCFNALGNEVNASEYVTIRMDTIVGKCVKITEESIEVRPLNEERSILLKELEKNGYVAKLRCVFYTKGKDLLLPRVIGFDLINPKNGEKRWLLD